MSAIRILIIEDDRDVTEMLRASLEPAYECLAAANGLEGWQAALEGEPDLIISDIMMPVMDGHEFIRKLRKDSAFNETPVIFLSALGSRGMIKKGYELGATLYLTKPIDLARLMRNIELFITDHHVTSRPKRKTVGEVERALKGSHAKLKPTTILASGPATKADAGEDRTREKTPAPKKDPKPEPRPSKIRLMVVDDDRDTIELIVAGLEEEYEILSASNGMDAIEMAVRYKPDVFILDGKMPRLSGYQLAQMLKRNAFFRDCPIIFISANKASRDKNYVASLGVRHFLGKPFEVAQLKGAIEEASSADSFSIHENRVPIQQARLESLYDFGRGRSRIH